MTRLMASGRHEGELPGPLPATGAEMHETALAIHRIADGKIVEHRSNRDDLALMQQLGVISLPDTSADSAPQIKADGIVVNDDTVTSEQPASSSKLTRRVVHPSPAPACHAPSGDQGGERADVIIGRSGPD